MTAQTPPGEGILLVDDGELDAVAHVLESEGIPYTRLRGGQIPAEIAPPRDLLIVTPRRVERVRRGAPADARPGRPLRIIGVDEDSPAMRRRLRREGLHLLIRLPADPEIWRLLIARALYKGSERRTDPRVAVGAPVSLENDSAKTKSGTMLLDLSNRGCRLETSAAVAIGDPIQFSLTEQSGSGAPLPALALRGRIRRLVASPDSTRNTIAVVFDEDLEESTRTQLTAVINHWASGPHSLAQSAQSNAPSIPPCQLRSLPDLTLDDETDPPVASSGPVEVALDEPDGRLAIPVEPARERRNQQRGGYGASVEAVGDGGPFVLIGRDLSAGGMRIERHPDLKIGDQFRLALRGPSPGDPFVVSAEVTRDDGPKGFGLKFDAVDPATVRELEKMVACLPDIESLEDGEMAGLGAVLSEVLEG